MPTPEQVESLRRLLASPSDSQQADALYDAVEYAEQAALAAWDDAEGQPPRERLLLALRAAAEELQGLTAELTGEEGPAEG